MSRERNCGVRIVPGVRALVGTLVFAAFAHAAPLAHADALPVTLAADAQPAAPAAKPATAPKPAKAPKGHKAPAPKFVHDPEAGPWDRGALWVTLRAGTNQVSYSTAGKGGFGYGFGFSHMLGPNWAFAGIVEHNVIGEFGEAQESEIPFTIELDRHIKMGPSFRPYFGFGGGAYYHKFSNTTADFSDVRGGGFFAVGGNIAIAKHNLFGLDGRMAVVSTRADNVPASNPVFGPQDSSNTRWSLKATWSVTY